MVHKVDAATSMAVLNVIPEPEKKCSGLETMQYDNPSIRHEFEDEFQLVETLFETHHTPSGNEQHFIYFVLLRE